MRAYIGKRFVQISYESIPKAKQAVYELTKLPDKEFHELCASTTTYTQIVAVTKRLAAPKEEPPKVDKAEMEARHAKELATPRPATPLAPPYQEAIKEAQQAALDSTNTKAGGLNMLKHHHRRSYWEE